MSASLHFDANNLRKWLHRIEEECASADATPEMSRVRCAALDAVRGIAATDGPGIQITAAPPPPAPDDHEKPGCGGAAEALPPIVIMQVDGAFTVQRGDLSAVRLCWDEMLGQVVNLTWPSGGGRLYAMQTEDERVAERRRHEQRRSENEARRRAIVTIEYPIEGARRLDASLADILCWAAGFRAARTDDTSTYPMGVEAVREIRAALTRAIEQAQSDEQ